MITGIFTAMICVVTGVLCKFTESGGFQCFCQWGQCDTRPMNGSTCQGYFVINFVHYQQWKTELDDKKNHFAAQQHEKKITTYYNIYKTDSPHSYTVTKTCLVFS